MTPLDIAFHSMQDRINLLALACEHEQAADARPHVLQTLSANQSAIVEEWILDEDLREHLYQNQGL